MATIKDIQSYDKDGEISKEELIQEVARRLNVTPDKVIDALQVVSSYNDISIDQTIEGSDEKLIELKTKIGVANADNMERIYRMEEYKSALARLDNINTDETSVFQKLTESTYKEFKRTVVYTASQILEMREQLQKECNRLQDEMDAFNATTKIDFESPLGR